MKFFFEKVRQEVDRRVERFWFVAPAGFHTFTVVEWAVLIVCVLYIAAEICHIVLTLM